MPKSAIDAIGPAFRQTQRQLFRPFRFGRWMRFSIIALATGEFASTGWGGSGIRIPANRGERKIGMLFQSASDSNWGPDAGSLAVVGIAVLATIVLILAWMYVASVFRFILLESVLQDRCEIMQGWRRWRPQGGRYFVWMLALSGAVLAGLVVIIGAPVLIAWRAGVFDNPREHLVLLIAGGLTMLVVVGGLVLTTALLALLGKDFLVPVLALENLTLKQALKRLGSLIRAEKLHYAGYFAMRIVLSFGSAILFGIVDLIVLFITLVPVALAAFGIIAIAQAGGLSWNVLTISAAIVSGSVIITGLLWLLAFIYTPGLVFFQSYPLHFLSSRYPPLAELEAQAPVPPYQ
ncbi:MAG TPA: hypothetical protein VGK99_07085 [Acidobacteriota bacterium]|jgi:hypothetical protein